MKHAVYLLIIFSFLRKLASRILKPAPRIVLPPGSPREPHGESPGHPVQVAVAVARTLASPRPKGEPTYDYFRVATCIDRETAYALADTLNDMEPGYGHLFFISIPDEEITGYALENLAIEKIRLNRQNIRKCPDPEYLEKIMQSAALSVILHGIYQHR